MTDFARNLVILTALPCAVLLGLYVGMKLREKPQVVEYIGADVGDNGGLAGSPVEWRHFRP